MRHAPAAMTRRSRGLFAACTKLPVRGALRAAASQTQTEDPT